MKKEILAHNKKIEYTLKRSKRAKRLRIAVYCDAHVVVTAPRKVNDIIIQKFIVSKAEWLFQKIDFFKKIEKRIFLKFSEKDYIKNKGNAHNFVTERVKKFNRVYRFTFNKIAIKNQKTKWGSCSKKRNLNFNYKLIFLPGKLAEYIIVHELCHLKEMNHSDKFWNLVRKTIPNFKTIRKEIEKVTL
jgi:hypothetical protein